jgi:hypothetical protein
VRDGSSGASIFTKQISEKIRERRVIQQLARSVRRNDWKISELVLDKLCS